MPSSPVTHANTAPYFLAVMDAFILTSAYGNLPFYLMDADLENGRMNGSHATDFPKLNSYVTFTLMLILHPLQEEQ